jgi:hypothetical protein
MPAKTITLPEGHKWEEVNFDSTHHDFVCSECKAHFSHDLIENVAEMVDEGEGHDTI